MGARCQRVSRVGGLTLIELLVAIAIGSVLAFGAMNLYLFSKLSYLQDEAMARLQENGRYALRYLSHELTMAGYLATLLKGDAIGVSISGSDCFNYLLNTAVAFEYVGNVTTSGLPVGAGSRLPNDCLLAGKHVQGSDLLLTRRSLDTPVVYRGERRGAIAADTVYLHTNTQGQAMTTRLQRGGSDWAAGADMWEYAPQLLFLRNYSLNAGDGIPTLCRRRLAKSSNRMAPTQCLVEGIENLQLEFGIDEDGDRRADYFAPDPVAAQLQTAVAVRIYLLVRSPRPIADYVDNKSYRLGRTLIPAAGDSYYRRVVQTTVLLRNTGGFSS